jgi:hypothetical protein
MVAWKWLHFYSLVVIVFVSLVRQWGSSQILGFDLISGRREGMMMVRMAQRMTGRMRPLRMRRRRLLVWMLMDIL